MERNRRRWSSHVETHWTPRLGLFREDALTIAREVLEGHNWDLASSVSAINFYVNRAGRNLSLKDRVKLRDALRIVQRKGEARGGRHRMAANGLIDWRVVDLQTQLSLLSQRTQQRTVFAVSPDTGEPAPIVGMTIDDGIVLLHTKSASGPFRNPHYTYTLVLTPEDVRTISFVGGRYSWSDALRGYDTGTHELAEHEAWELADAFAADTEGGHSPFPMLSDRSDLYSRLQALWDSIV